MPKPNLKDKRTIKRYSEAFKLQVLEEVSTGQLTKSEACRKYGFGMQSLYHWIKKYGKLELYNPRVRIQMPDEQDELKRLKAELKEVKEALIKSHLDHLKSSAYLEVALEMMTDQERAAYEKKLAAKQSKKS